MMASTVPLRTDLTPIQEKGLEWVWLLTSGKATEADLAEMVRWRAESPEHAEALASASRVRDLLAEQQKYSDVHPSLWQAPATRRVALSGLALAVVGYGALKPPLGAWPSLAELAAEYRTGVGERRQLALAGGLSVDLNTRTSISIRSVGKNPVLDLVQGEIALTTKLPRNEVATVYAGDCQIAANDGSVDVRRDQDNVQITCVRGTARLLAGRATATIDSGHRVNVVAGVVGKMASIDPMVATGWREGRLIFHNASLREIVADVNRYRYGRILIVNSELGRRRFDGVFEIAKLDNAVPDLEKLTNAAATSLPGGVVLLG